MTTVSRIDEYVRKLVGLGATDLLLSSERPPLYRAANELLPLPGEGLVADAELRTLVTRLLDADEQQALQDDFRVAFQAELLGGLRGAGSCHLAQHGLTLRLRLLGGLDLQQIDLSLPPNVPSLLHAEAGLIVVTGAAGSGKSSWIARYLQLMAAQRPLHIATLDEPVEYVLPPSHGAIAQRAVGRHCRTFAEGIDAALEANAQVIAVSDLQAPGVFERMLEAAGAGVLAIGELRGYGAVAALEQLLSAVPAGLRTQFAGDLRRHARGRALTRPRPTQRRRRPRAGARALARDRERLRARARRQDADALVLAGARPGHAEHGSLPVGSRDTRHHRGPRRLRSRERQAPVRRVGVMMRIASAAPYA